MIRNKWISYLFSIAFAMSVTHSIARHAHSESGASHEHVIAGKHYPEHHHSDEPDTSLPVVAHFANDDVISPVKYTYPVNLQPALVEQEHPLVISAPSQCVSDQLVHLPRSRDLPDKILLFIQLLRAPPY